MKEEKGPTTYRIDITVKATLRARLENDDLFRVIRRDVLEELEAWGALPGTCEVVVNGYEER